MAAQKLSILGLAGYALKAMVARFGTLLGLCAPALLIVVAAAVLGRLLYPTGDAAGLSSFAVILSVATLLASVALVPAFTGWHRLLVLGDVRRDNGRALGWNRLEWRYLVRMLQMWLAMFVVQLGISVIVSIAGDQAVAIAAAIATLIAYLMIWAMLGLALPAAALGDERPLNELLRPADGNFGRIACAIALVWLAVAGLGMLLGVALALAGAVLETGYLVFVFGVMFYYIGMVASVGVLSRAYTLLIR